MGQYFLDPVADVKAGWTEAPVGTAFSCVDDGIRQPTVPAGTDWIFSSTTTSNCTLDLSTFTIPAGEIVSKVTAWIYCTVPSTNHQINLNMITTGSPTSSAVTPIASSGWKSNVWDTRSFSQSEINGLQIQMVLTEWSPEAGDSYITNCYVEVTTISDEGPYFTAVMAKTPALYWRFGDTGSTVADHSGNGRTGTFHGDVTKNEPSLVPTEEVNGSLHIDVGTVTGPGTGTPVSGVSANTYKPWVVGSKRSVAMWFRSIDRTHERFVSADNPSGTGLGAPTLFAGDSFEPAGGGRIKLGNPHPTWEVIDSRNGTVRFYGSVNTFPFGWNDLVHGFHHGQLVFYVSTFDDVKGVRTDYINGVPAGASDEGYPPPGYPPSIPHFETADDPGHLTIGYRDAPTGIAETFAGWVDEFALFERLLTATDVADLWIAGVGEGGSVEPPEISGERPNPPLELTGQVTDAEGHSMAWGADAKGFAQMQAISFTTGRGDGFKTLTLTLARNVDRDWPDLQLYNTVTLYGLDGETAWEGRISGMPRDVAGQSTITVECVGWMAHTRDAKFREIYVHRDLSSWITPSTALREYWITGNYSPTDGQVVPDNAGFPCLQMEIQAPWSATARPISSMWFDSGGIPIGSIYHAWRTSINVVSSHAQWAWFVQALDSDQVGALIAPDTTGNLLNPGPGSGTLNTLTSATRVFAAVTFLYFPTDGGDVQPVGTGESARFNLNWNVLAVYGKHGLAKVSNATDNAFKDAPGFTASQIIRDIVQRFCPAIKADGVVNTSLVIPHASYIEPTSPADAMIALNAPHNFGLEVWEDRILHWAPVDLTKATWHVRTDDQNLTVSLQGDTTDDVANGVTVRYTDFLGRVRVLTPDLYPQLQSTDPNLPATLNNLNVWTDIEVPFPTSQAVAINVGQAALAEFNRPKAPGTITVRGHVRDARDIFQQVWKVRAGDSVAITDFPNDKPRLITETSYDHDTNTMSITVDGTARTIDAWFERITGALSARGLS